MSSSINPPPPPPPQKKKKKKKIGILTKAAHLVQIWWSKLDWMMSYRTDKLKMG